MLQGILLRLDHWKERLLFGLVALLTLLTAVSARPISGRVDDIHAEIRLGRARASGLEQETIARALTLLDRPVEISPTPLDVNRVEALYYDERDVYLRTRPSAWVLSRQSYEPMPAISLALPGLTGAADFDMPAGPRPEPRLWQGLVPRETRLVRLSPPEEGAGP
jgi:hypothetical protein